MMLVVLRITTSLGGVTSRPSSMLRVSRDSRLPASSGSHTMRLSLTDSTTKFTKIADFGGKLRDLILEGVEVLERRQLSDARRQSSQLVARHGQLGESTDRSSLLVPYASGSGSKNRRWWRCCAAWRGELFEGVVGEVQAGDVAEHQKTVQGVFMQRQRRHLRHFKKVNMKGINLAAFELELRQVGEGEDAQSGGGGELLARASSGGGSFW